MAIDTLVQWLKHNKIKLNLKSLYGGEQYPLNVYLDDRLFPLSDHWKVLRY